MRTILYTVILILGTNDFLSQTIKQPSSKFEHQFNYSHSTKIVMWGNGGVGYYKTEQDNLCYKLSYIQTSKRSFYLAADFQAIRSFQGVFFQTNVERWNYKYIGLHLGVNKKISPLWDVNFQLGMPIVKWFESNVLTGYKSKDLWIHSTENSSTQARTSETKIKSLLAVELVPSVKIYKNVRLLFGLKYYYALTTPQFNSFKINNALSFKIGLSYTF